jgi:hypothetical protein
MAARLVVDRFGRRSLESREPRLPPNRMQTFATFRDIRAGLCSFDAQADNSKLSGPVVKTALLSFIPGTHVRK